MKWEMQRAKSKTMNLTLASIVISAYFIDDIDGKPLAIISEYIIKIKL